MTHMNEAKRAALRAEWETGRSNRDLARRYGMSEGIVRHWAKRENWQRDETAIETIHTRAQMLTVAHLTGPETPRHATAGCGGIARPMTLATYPAEPAIAQRPETVPHIGAAGAGETYRELSMEMVAQALAAAQIAQLDRAAALARVFDQIAELLEPVLVLVDPDVDPEAARKQSLALATLLPGGNSATLSSILLVWTRLAESIQTQERRALGVEDRPRRGAIAGSPSEPVQTENASKFKKPDFKLDLSKFSPAELETLLDAAAIMNGHEEPRPIGVPPTGPGEVHTDWTTPTEAGADRSFAKH